MILDLPPLPNNVLSGRYPKWSFEKVQHRPCPICDSDSPEPIVRRPDKFVVHKCSKCRMVYLADVPRMEEIEKFYREYGAFKRYPQRTRGMPWLKRVMANKTNPFISILESTGGVKGLSVCEIGCSYGGFLELIRHKKGRPFGVELDDNARCFVESKGIPVTAEIDLNQHYDIVCLFQVLEHLVSPREVVSTISKTLNTDGRVLISIPNSGDYEKVGPSWVGFRVDLEHINYFNLQNLSELLCQHGLYIEQFWEHTQPGIQRAVIISEHTPNPVTKIKRVMGYFYQMFFGERFVNTGTFVLTALYRKV